MDPVLLLHSLVLAAIVGAIWFILWKLHWLEDRVGLIRDKLDKHIENAWNKISTLDWKLDALLLRPTGGRKCGFNPYDYAVTKAKVELLWRRVRELEEKVGHSRG